MSFFDSKLEVLDFQLTQYGKHLLSLGKLRPYYYAFYDHDVIYDSEYASLTEIQNDIEPRIQENTPRLKPQYMFHGAETELDNSYEPINIKNKLLFYDHIGTSKYEGDNVPTWDIKLINNTISSSVPYFTSSFNKIINLPQLNLNLDYNLYYIKIENIDTSSFSANEAPTAPTPNDLFLSVNYEDAIETYFTNTVSTFGPYEDEAYITVEQKNFIIDVMENNNFDEKDSFEIEVFEYTDDTEDNLKQLYFFQNYLKNVENDILLDSQQILSKIPNIQINENYVEYYFNIIVDNFIANDIVCKHIDNGIYNPKLKTKYRNIVKCKQTTTAQNQAVPSLNQQSEKCDV